MNKFTKFSALILSLVLVFSSCGKVSPSQVSDSIKAYFDKNDYNGCKSYLIKLDSKVKSEVSDEALNLIIDEFNEIYKPYEKNDIYDIALFNSGFVNNCAKLWTITTEFTPTEEKKFNEALQNLRYFSELSDSLRYQELFRMLKNMHNCGYFTAIQKALNDYEVLGESESFETAQKVVSSFKYTDYNPNEYYITELRESCEKLNKYLSSVNNGFATNDTEVIANAINNIYKISDILLFACDSANSVFNSINEIMNNIKLNGAFTDFEIKINFDEKRDYNSNIEFPIVNIFGAPQSDPFAPEDVTDDGSETDTGISQNEAIAIAVNALNKTKGYSSNLSVEKIQTVNVQMTSFKTVSEITSEISLVKIRINDALKKSNGTTREVKYFENGACEDTSLYGYIPPSGRPASLDPSLIDSYTAFKGSGGYVITFNLKSCTSTDDNLSYNLLSMVNGFYFDEDAANMQHKTFYGPTTISLIVNNSGDLIKYSYSINGASSCKFYENNEQVATGEFSFNEQFSYTFTY